MWAAESQDRAVFRIALTEDEQQIVNAERDCHPDSHIRRKRTRCASYSWAVAARGLVEPITLVLDNARYQRNAIVMALARQLGIELLFLPSCSPNLNLSERLSDDARGDAGIADDAQLPGV